jgi:hypothetical protein
MGVVCKHDMGKEKASWMVSLMFICEEDRKTGV